MTRYHELKKDSRRQQHDDSRLAAGERNLKSKRITNAQDNLVTAVLVWNDCCIRACKKESCFLFYFFLDRSVGNAKLNSFS
jgi:hypothetical protein